jgi:hypothetical protein
MIFIGLNVKAGIKAELPLQLREASPASAQMYGVPCKICGFHGGHYEECRLLGYKNPVRT